MDPLAQFEADRYPDWRALLKLHEASCPDYNKLYEAALRLTPPDRDLLHAAMEAQRPPVSERLTPSELEALIDRTARWVPPQARTPSPVPRYGRGEGGRRIRSPSLIRRIRADRLNREKADELASLKEKTARMTLATVVHMKGASVEFLGARLGRS